jgi:lysophospholipase L1-like esterase
MIYRKLQVSDLRRTTSLLAAAIVLVLLTVLMTPAVSLAADGEYGAIAWSPVNLNEKPGTGTVGFGRGNSREDAEGEAIDDCINKGGATNCVVFIWFQNAWGALATSANGHVGSGWGWHSTSSDEALKTAKNYALENCLKVGGENCKVKPENTLAAGSPGEAEGTGGLGPEWDSSGAGNWHYAVLGDSFSAGWGLEPYDVNSPYSTPPECGRSPQAYGPLLGKNVPTLGELAFFACEGAVTDDYYSVGKTQSQQFQLQLTSNVHLIMLTMSGNDLGFGQTIRACAVIGECRQDPSARFDALKGKGDAYTPPNDNGEIRPIHPLAELLLTIHEDASKDGANEARIFLGGYPRLFGTDESKYKDRKGRRGNSCKIGQLGTVAYEDALWINDQTDELNKVLEEAVEAANAATPAKASEKGLPEYFVFVPVFEDTKSEGKSGKLGEFNYETHGLCDTGESWIQSIKVQLGDHVIEATEGVHPTEKGQKAYMEAFRQAAGL